MKFGWFIREELSAYKAHVTLSAKHLSQEHTGFAFINKLHRGFWHVATGGCTELKTISSILNVI